MDFTGKRLIVTGGAKGIGRAVAEGILARGGTAIIVDIDRESAEKTLLALDSPRAFFYEIDLGKPEEIRSGLRRILAEHEQVHGLINNAGIISTTPFEELQQDEWDRVLAVNLTAQYVTSSVLFQHMKEHGYGKIVNVSSVAGKRGGAFSGKSAYAASKAGIIGLTKSIAIEGGPYGIYCNAVCPAATDTSMTNRELAAKRSPDAKCPIPLGRRAAPSEIANMILFFASDEASFITGEIGVADGGMVMCS